MRLIRFSITRFNPKKKKKKKIYIYIYIYIYILQTVRKLFHPLAPKTVANTEMKY